MHTAAMDRNRTLTPLHIYAKSRAWKLWLWQLVHRLVSAYPQTCASDLLCFAECVYTLALCHLCSGLGLLPYSSGVAPTSHCSDAHRVRGLVAETFRLVLPLAAA